MNKYKKATEAKDNSKKSTAKLRAMEAMWLEHFGVEKTELNGAVRKAKKTAQKPPQQQQLNRPMAELQAMLDTLDCRRRAKQLEEQTEGLDDLEAHLKAEGGRWKPQEHKGKQQQED